MSDLTHDEIWDDSALVQSWNQALSEYKKYHSIHAKGGKLEDLLDANDKFQTDAKPETAEGGQAVTGGGSDALEQQDETAAMVEDGSDAGKGVEATKKPSHESGPSVAPGVPVGISPQVVLGSVQDESLKKLLLSWYYAGYYTGLFEGQQQSQRQEQ